MGLLLGKSITEPFWTFVYYLLYNSMAVSLVILLPPKLVRLYRRNHTPDGKLKPARKAKSVAVDAKKVEAINTKTADQVEELFSTSSEELGVNSWPTFVDIGLAPIAYVTYTIFSNIAYAIMRGFSWFDAEQTQNVGFSGYLFASDRIFAMLAIVFIAPIAEELIMRGWLYGKLRNHLKIIPAMLLVSLLFAILHGQLNVAIAVFILSSLLCGLREITGTIWSGMLLHIISNGIAFYILYVGI